MKAIFYQPPIEDNFIPHILKEVYIDRIYHPFLVGRKDLTIVEIGANLGIVTDYFAKYAKRLYAVEPAQQHYAVLEEVVRFNNLKHVKPLKYAIGNTPGTMTLNHNPNRTMFSLNPAVSSGQGEAVEVITIEQLFKEHKIKHCDFLKLDVEGVECEILGGQPFATIAEMIHTIVVEWHSWSGRNPGQLVQSLEQNGFYVSTLPTDASVYVGVRR